MVGSTFRCSCLFLRWKLLRLKSCSKYRPTVAAFGNRELISTRTGNHDGNVSETIKPIAEDKRSTCEDVGIILRNYHSRSSVVRDDKAIKPLAEI